MAVLLTSFGPTGALAAVAGALAEKINVKKTFTVSSAGTSNTSGDIQNLIGRGSDPKLVEAILDAESTLSASEEVLVIATDGAAYADPMAFVRNLRLANAIGAQAVVVADGGCLGDESCQSVTTDIIDAAKNEYVPLHSILLFGQKGNTPKVEGVEIHRLDSLTSDYVLNNLNPVAITPDIARGKTMSPERFEHQLISMARAAKSHIVLAEGEEERILKAADKILAHRMVDLTLLGSKAQILEQAEDLGLDLSNANILDPHTDERRDKLIDVLVEARKDRGMTKAQATELMDDVNWFGTMLIHAGEAEGMVSGAVHTTAETIRPALQVIRTVPNVNAVSSCFLMALPDQVVVFADCAVAVNPDARELSEIAQQSANTAAAFGIEPKVAMLSYSTGVSGSGEDVERAKKATELAKAANPSLLIDGPLQFDAAFDKGVGASKAPNSPVAGQATVFIFPDLESGNVAYKAVQRTAGAVAIGPILQGLAKPVNDLSRGATIADIVNTVAITAIQAGFAKK